MSVSSFRSDPDPERFVVERRADNKYDLILDKSSSDGANFKPIYGVDNEEGELESYERAENERDEGKAKTNAAHNQQAAKDILDKKKRQRVQLGQCRKSLEELPPKGNILHLVDDRKRYQLMKQIAHITSDKELDTQADELGKSLDRKESKQKPVLTDAESKSAAAIKKETDLTSMVISTVEEFQCRRRNAKPAKPVARVEMKTDTSMPFARTLHGDVQAGLSGKLDAQHLVRFKFLRSIEGKQAACTDPFRNDVLTAPAPEAKINKALKKRIDQEQFQIDMQLDTFKPRAARNLKQIQNDFPDREVLDDSSEHGESTESDADEDLFETPPPPKRQASGKRKRCDDSEPSAAAKKARVRDDGGHCDICKQDFKDIRKHQKAKHPNQPGACKRNTAIDKAKKAKKRV
jgi:hypothetical protein